MLPPSAAADDSQRFAAFTADVQPLLARFCIRCHGGEEPEADLRLDRFKSPADLAAAREVLQTVLDNVEAGYMPPEDKPQPSAQQRQAIVAWLSAELSAGHDPTQASPGRVTMRRLNRVEYNNTIRDLVGVDFEPAADFPSDDVGYGFDNIGDVLSLPPILMEKYLAAAERITEAAIVVPDPIEVQSVRLQAEHIQQTGAADRLPRDVRVRTLASNGEIYTTHRFPKTGEYILRARAYGQQAGPEAVKMAFRIEGRDVDTVDVTAVSRSPKTYETRVRVEQGVRRVAVAFINDYYAPDAKDPKLRGDRNLYVDYIEIQGPVRVELVNLPPTHRRIVFVTPSATRSRTECARQIIEPFAARAWRRPLAPDELDRLVNVFHLGASQGESFERSIQLALQAVLVSPHFLFRVEIDRGPLSSSGAYRISQYELASRLSYFLWSSMPDDELFDLARQGDLRKNLDAQVRRMLADPKSQALVDNFGHQWLTTRNLAIAEPDPKLFPKFDEKLRADMLKETELFLAAVIREDRSILDLIDADFTFVNQRLAAHYGLPGVQGDQFRRVALPDNRRGGVLTLASVLTVTSNPTRTSPVKRGKWVLENILGTPPPPPPPGVPELEEDEQVRLTGSLRQRMEQHRTNPTCASCHSRMDPIGFGFENFDAVGAWRQRDGKFAIDPAGTLPSGESFDGPAALKAIFKQNKDGFTRCLAEKMLTYALGRGLEPYDRHAVNEIVAATARGDYRFSSLILATVHSRPFQWRAAQRGQP